MAHRTFKALDSDIHIIAVDSFLGLPISEQSKQKILWDNCAAYYGLPA